MKTCTRCNKEKDETLFVLDRTRNRRKSQCASCTSLKAKEWRKKNPNYEKHRYRHDKVNSRERHLIRKYGVDLHKYNELLRAQNGRCAICGGEESDQFKQVFHVDHCHSTGRVRGLLCRGCNHVLGHLKDNPELLLRASNYLSSAVVPQVVEALGRMILEVRA